MTRVLVTGTDRPTGQAMIPRLLRHDISPIALAGNVDGPVVTIDQETMADHTIAVDLDTRASLTQALDGVDALVHVADVRPGGSSSVLGAAQALARACVANNVHLVYVSRVGADQSSLDHRKGLWESEQLLERTDRLDVTIQRITHPHPALAQLMQGPWLPLPSATPIQPVSPDDVAGRVVGLIRSGPSGRVREYGGPELMRFADAAHIYKQVRGSVPRKVPLPKLGVIGEAVAGIHVTRSGDRGNETFRTWLKGAQSAGEIAR